MEGLPVFVYEKAFSTSSHHVTQREENPRAIVRSLSNFLSLVVPPNRNMSNNRAELYTLNEKESECFLFSSLMKRVLKSPKKSTMINDLINNC